MGDWGQAVFSCLSRVSRSIMACRISGRSAAFASSRATISSIWAGAASADAARAVAGSAGGFLAGVGEVRAISPTR